MNIPYKEWIKQNTYTQFTLYSVSLAERYALLNDLIVEKKLIIG